MRIVSSILMTDVFSSYTLNSNEKFELDPTIRRRKYTTHIYRVLDEII